MILLMFLCALGLSAAAAFYSVVGLMAIFAAAPIPIAIMGSLLEASKLVIASWLYRNWKTAPFLMRSYLTVALVILMALTSMGIFGFLSKAHMEQGVPTTEIAAKVAIIDEKINIEKENINAARKSLNQLDDQVNQTLTRTATATDDSAVNRSVAIRRNQAKERSAISNDLERSRTAIAKLTEEKAPFAAELRKVEAEVGPIKYIAAVIYGDEATKDPTILEKAVRWVTKIIVAVFDPLAVVMLIAANWSLAHRVRTEDDIEPLVIEDVPSIEPEPVPEIKKPKRSPKVKPKMAEPVPDTQPEEHPVFVADSETWGSRPAAHLQPHNIRGQPDNS